MKERHVSFRGIRSIKGKKLEVFTAENVNARLLRRDVL